MNPPKTPEDVEKLGIKIGTKDEAFWTSVKTKVESTILQCQREIVIQEHLLKLTEMKINIEKNKMAIQNKTKG